MEKVITYTNSDGDELNGVLTKGDTSKCVIFTHGFLSDKDENTLYSSLAETLARHDISSFRFDFRGCGESEDVPLSFAGMKDDLSASVSLIQTVGYDEIYLLGHSLGAAPIIASDIHTEHVILLTPFYKADKPRDDDLITITNRFNVEHRLPRSFAEKLGSVNLENRLEKISKKTTAFLANSDEIMPSNYYEHILKSKKKFNNVVLLDTNHFFTTNRKPLFDHILSLIKD